MRDDPRVGVRAAHEGGVQHARQRDVVGVAAAPGHGALGAGARQGAADVAVGPVERGAERCLSDIVLDIGVSSSSSALASVVSTASTMAWIAGAAAVVAGQEACGSPRALLARRLASSSAAVISMPGVQKPHCSALRATNAACRSAISPVSVSPSMVTTSAPSACTASIRQPRTTAPSTRTEQAPHTPCSQPRCEPVRPRSVRRKSTRCWRTGTDARDALAVDGQA